MMSSSLLHRAQVCTRRASTIVLWVRLTRYVLGHLPSGPHSFARTGMGMSMSAGQGRSPSTFNLTAQNELSSSCKQLRSKTDS